MKILIIEDELALQESIQTYLSRQGFVCEAVSDFVSAIKKVQQYIKYAAFLRLSIDNE